MKNQKTTILIFTISLIGFALFFPARFSDNECCLGDLWTIFGNHFHTGIEHQHGAHHHDGGLLVHRYLFPFGFLWWSSIALGYWSIRRLMNKNMKGQNEHFSEHSPVV